MLPGYYQYFWEVNVSCSRIKHGDLSEDRTSYLSLRSPTLYHLATAPSLIINYQNNKTQSYLIRESIRKAWLMLFKVYLPILPLFPGGVAFNICENFSHDPAQLSIICCRMREPFLKLQPKEFIMLITLLCNKLHLITSDVGIYKMAYSR